MTSVNPWPNIFDMGISGLVLLVAVGVVDYVTQLDDGTLSPSLTLPADMRSVQFRAVNTANIFFGGLQPDTSTTSDGAAAISTGTTNTTSLSGTMSGMELTGRFGMLGMVFLNNATAMPNLPSPADLRWSNR